jgi:hypothetical protein
MLSDIEIESEDEMKTLKSIVTRALVAATVAAVLFTITGAADASTGSRHKDNHGTLKIETPTQVSGYLLQPGEYEVKAKNTATGAVIEISRWHYDPYAAEGLPVYSSEVVAVVDAMPQTGMSAPASTGLLLAGENSGKAVGVQIRGDNTEYRF